ncbi:glycosyltransferase family 2 protein [Treponema primitia]|uniref:glycosyltransferase family 2 protein n=1 Tax=Treponema primitia TaxID=88058 RepID=UPI000255569A|nr:glycosyltransferase [Treponema primitia]
MPIISIIIPIYKAEKYLQKCVDSILSQTFTDFECILVDDGSPDKSSDICDEYAVRDSRIFVIHQKNSGRSSARNAGLNIAKGEWIGFIDADDWCELEMFQFLYENAKKYSADISACCRKRVTSDDDIGVISERRKVETLYDGQNAIYAMLKQDISRVVTDKIFSSYFFKECNIQFDDKIKKGQDLLLYYEVLRYAKKIIYSPHAYYNYFINNPDSVTNQKGLTEDVKTAFLVYEKMLKIETNKKIRKIIITRKVNDASELILYYISVNDYINKSCKTLTRFVKDNVMHILFDFSYPIRNKILVLLSLNPKLCYLLRNNYKFIKQSLKALLKHG